MITENKIKMNLCYYDIRNPVNIEDEELMKQKKIDKERGTMCYCDNCFRGKTELAEELIRLNKKIKELSC